MYFEDKTMNNELEDTRKQALYIANNLTDLVMAYRIANDDYRVENQQLRAKVESLSEAEVNLIAENQQLQNKIELLEDEDIAELKNKILALEYQAEIDKDEIKSLREYIEKFQKPANHDFNLDVISLLNDYVAENIYSDWVTNLTRHLIQDYKQLLKKYNLFLSVNLAGKDITIR